MYRGVAFTTTGAGLRGPVRGDEKMSTRVSYVGVRCVRASFGVPIAGQTYVFEINARAAPGVDLAATPAVYTLPEGYASITTTMAP